MNSEPRLTLHAVLAAALSILLAACASAPATHSERRFFADALFRPATERIDAKDVFAVSPEMQRYVQEDIARQIVLNGKQGALVEALYATGELKLDYDTEMTRNAAEAFAARSGNCLSLVIMTAAFAKQVGLEVEFQRVFIDDTWARDGDVYLSIGHVNLTLARRKSDAVAVARIGAKYRESDAITIDFLSPEQTKGMWMRGIDEQTVIAMFMNNRAVEAMAHGKLDDAYWWAREGILQAPANLPTYNTLGAIYRLHGDLHEAEAVLRFVVDSEPRSKLALSNLIPVVAAQGRADEAKQLTERLALLDPDPAFIHYQRGLAALQVGDVKAAKAEFLQEVARAPDYHEFHYWLAITYLRLGETEAARKHMAIALQQSSTRRDHDIYAAKLDMISRKH